MIRQLPVNGQDIVDSKMCHRFPGPEVKGQIQLFRSMVQNRPADHVAVPENALSVLSNHSDKALILLVYGLILTGVIILTHFRHLNRIKWVDGTLAFLGVAGLGLLIVTADAGGRLVFGYGVGVKKVQESPMNEIVEQTNDDKAVLKIQKDGLWKWESGIRNSVELMV